MIIDNRAILILTQLNELASSYRLSPVEFLATLETNEDGRRMLSFVTPPIGGRTKERFSHMLAALGLTGKDTLTLQGTDDKLVAALGAALRHAPSQRNR